MEKFVRLTDKACPLLLPNVNTDMILPARYLKLPRTPELGDTLFYDLRRDAAGNERPDFLLNQPMLARRQDPHRRPQFRRRLLARGGRLCALRSRHPLRDRVLVRRHLCAEFGQERPAGRRAIRAGRSRNSAPPSPPIRTCRSRSISSSKRFCAAIAASASPSIRSAAISCSTAGMTLT